MISIQNQDKLDDKGKDDLGRIRSNSQRMAKLIDDILSLSRLSRIEMMVRETDLSRIANMIIQEYREREPDRQVEVVIEPGLVDICDPNLLEVVLDNLLANAWKFMSKRENARIEFGRFLENQENPQRWVYFVRDNGAGFDMHYADKLFGAFQRLHAMNEFSGTGIGLATVQRIIHQHGGRVWANAEVNQGATLYFTLHSDTLQKQ